MTQAGGTASRGGCRYWQLRDGEEDIFAEVEGVNVSYQNLHCGVDIVSLGGHRSVYATIDGTHEGYFGPAGQHGIVAGGHRYIYIHVTNPFGLQQGDQITSGTYLGEYTNLLGRSWGSAHLDVTFADPRNPDKRLRYQPPLTRFNLE
jgi:hypothetical protein